ncbi:MAG: hypothetical protein GX101_00255 [Firmicutes bacterium]|jgi:hypothetical protein|nr:hypothetical protein [Bacillota bacterium]NLO65106.1 hypothetical protein [Bacillota bacterium]
MAILIAVGFLLVGIFEVAVWPERPLRKVAAYVVLLAAMAVLSVLVTLEPQLPVPSPLDWVKGLYERLVKGVQGK